LGPAQRTGRQLAVGISIPLPAAPWGPGSVEGAGAQRRRPERSQAPTAQAPLLGSPASLARFGLGPFGGLGPVTGNIQLHDDTVMDQAVDGCRRRHRILEDLFPLGEGSLILRPFVPLFSGVNGA